MVQLKMVEQNTQEKKKVLNVSSKYPWKKKKLKKVKRDTKESKKKKSFNVAKKKKKCFNVEFTGEGKL